MLQIAQMSGHAVTFWYQRAKNSTLRSCSASTFEHARAWSLVTHAWNDNCSSFSQSSLPMPKKILLLYSLSHKYPSPFQIWYLFSSLLTWQIKKKKPSVQFSQSVMSNSLWPHGLQHSRPPCPSPTPGAYSNSCPSCRWCHPTISSSVVPFSSCLQSFPAPGSFPMSLFFASGGQVLEFQLHHQSFQWIFRTDFL